MSLIITDGNMTNGFLQEHGQIMCGYTTKGKALLSQELLNDHASLERGVHMWICTPR